MTLPSEIRKLLEVEPRAHAALGCGLHGPIGETHLVLAGGRVLVFTRESLVGSFARVELAALPKLERGDFADTLHLQLADGTDAELNVSSFERDAVVALLTAAVETPAAPVPPPPSRRQVTPAEPQHNEGLPPKPAARETEGKAKFPTQSATEAQPETEPEKEKPDKQAGKEVAVYHGSDPGCIGCVAYLVVFGGAVVGFWFLHTEAARTVGMIGPSETEQDSFSFIATKVVALIAGAYLGGRLIQLVNSLLRAFGLVGKVMFSQSVIQVFGPSGKWHVMYSTPLPLEVTLRCHKSGGDSEQNGKPVKQLYNYYLGLSQNGQSVLLKTSHYTVTPLREIAGIPVTPVAEEPKNERQFGMEYQTFKHVARRIAKLR